jgi:NAD(P)-dependent dehydrogenase (short-subunit alcohol dehydrogenase family)
VLVNNAANDVRHTLEEIDSETFDRLIAVNLKHAFFAAKAVVPMMKNAGSGSIINLGSVGWMMASAGYRCTPAAAHGMTRALARELGPNGIRVNTLVPGWVMTEKQLALWVDDAAKELISRSQCLPGVCCRNTSPTWRCFLPPMCRRCVRRRTLSWTAVGCRPGYSMG